MRSVVAAAALAAIGAIATAPRAHAIGCLSGAAAGGVAGHVAGHHGVLGAAAGCAVGHHEGAVNRHKAAAAHSEPTQAAPQSGTTTQQ